MEIDFAHTHNPNLFGSLSVSPPTSMLDSFSPLLHFNDEFLDALNPTLTSTTDEDMDDWLKPLLLDQLFDHDFLLQPTSIQATDHNSNISNDLRYERPVEEEKRRLITLNNNCSFLINEKFLTNNYTQQQQQQHTQRENDLMDFFHQRSAEQQLPSTTTTTVRVIHQPKMEPSELPTTLFVSGNELQFHPIVTTNTTSNGKTIGHTYTTTTASPVPSGSMQSSVPIVPARVLKGKKFKRGGRMTSRATSRSHAAAKRRLNSTAAEPKASVVIIAEDATRIDSKTTTLGLSSTGSCASDTDMMKSASTVTSTRSSARRRVKSAPREVILFRNGAFISKEPIAKQQSSTTLCFETTTNNNCPQAPPPLHQQQITATGLQAAAQIVACNVLRQATLNDALIEQLIKREPANTDDDFPIYCYSSPSMGSSSCSMAAAAMDEYENSCSTTLKILGCNTTAPLHSTTSNSSGTTTTTTIELLTFAALQQQQHQPQFCYIKQEPGTTTTTTTTFLLPRLLPQ